MMSLVQNQRPLYYANPVGEPAAVTNESGDETSEYSQNYSKPQLIMCNVSAATGEAMEEAFGAFTDYSRVVSTCDTNCPLAIGSRVWFGITPVNDTPHNYEVVRVADALNSLLIALREVMA